MIILGIANNMHIASAALLSEGKIVAAAAEERFTRVKHTRSFPINAIRFCLKKSNITIEDVDYICLSADPGIDLSVYDRRYADITRWYPEALYSVPNNLSVLYENDYIGPTEQVFKTAKASAAIKYIRHHLCHAANAFFLSPFESSAILTVDGRGEKITALFGLGNGTDIKEIRSVNYPHSLGLFYGAITEYLGFKPDRDEGKVMGMAGFGISDNPYYQILRNLIVLDDDGTFQLDLNHFRHYMSPRHNLYADTLVSLLGPARKPEEDYAQKHFDIAAALQKVTEEVLIHMLGHLHKITKMDSIVVGGGVFMNSVFNGKLLDVTPFKKFFVSSCPDDCGTSIGAAMYMHHVVEKGIRNPAQDHNYYGPTFSEEEIIEELRKAKLPIVRVDDITQKTATLLAEGKIVGWYQGAMEFGQRALGHRSILADPRHSEMKDILNRGVKYREWFRPFAPAVLEEDFKQFFPNYDPANSKFMSLALPVKKSERDLIPAAMHVDSTARAQTVYAETSPIFHKLITEFKNLTGVGVLLNTSFNIQSEPIVCSPRDAIRTFYGSGLDVLVMGDHMLNK